MTMPANDPGPAHRIHVRGIGDFLAVVPRMLGFMPEQSLVVAGLRGDRGRLHVVMRYDLTADQQERRDLAEHAAGMLSRNDCSQAVAVGYGSGPEVTPVMDQFRAAAADAGVGVHDALRVDEGRYWSYLCTEPACHPAEGTPLGPENVAAPDLDRVGEVRGRREDLAAAIAPVTGERARDMEKFYARAVRDGAQLVSDNGRDALVAADLAAVQSAITEYRDGGQADDERLARVGVAVRDIRVRDDAWARMVPEHAADHSRLWADTTRTAPAGFAAAPASLLAFTEAQQGHGAQANIALDRAQAADPGYSMAGLLRQAVNAGIPPSELRLPMTPEEVAAAYGHPGRDETAAPQHETSPTAAGEAELEAGA